jgi:hypothetical protein
MVCRSYALVPDAGGERLLLLRGANGWEIPHRETDESRWWHVMGDLNQALGELLGLEVTTLRCLSNARVGDERQVRFYELENHGPDRASPRAAWLGRDDLERIDLAEPEHRPLLVRCLAERDDDGGRLRVPWARPGWFAEAVAWIHDRLRELGLEATSVTQERTWSISTVLRAATRDGDFYFKAVGLMFAGEPALTRELGRRHPGQVPVLTAVDEDRGWMLMRDLGGEPLSASSPPSSLAEALRAYARMQLSWIGRGDELTTLGCPDRTLDTLEARIEPLLGATELLLPGHPEGLSPSQLEAVPALVERLQTACEALRAHELPPTLEHGDLHTDNVRERDGDFVVFDWSDGCLSVPFFSLVPFFEFHPSPLDASLRALLRDAYVEAWTALAPRERLVEAFELAQFVGLFHQAISYRRITEHTEPRARWEWERGFPSFVKRLLERTGIALTPRRPLRTLSAMTLSTLSWAWSWPRERGGSVA